MELIPNRDLHVDHPRCRAHGHPSCEFIWRWQPENVAPEDLSLTSRDITEIGRELVQITDQETLGRAIAELILRQLPCTSVGVYRLPRAGGEAKLLHQVSRGEGGVIRRFVIEIRGRAVGRLEIGVPEGTPLPDLFEDLLPWFALALDATRDPLEELARRLGSAAERWGLTPRQADVLAELARGRCNKDIAQNLSLQPGTVEIHVSQILKKAGSESRATLIAEIWSSP